MWACATVETKPWVLAFGIVDGFVGLRNVFLESDGISQLTFAFALQFLEAGKTGLRGGETPRRGGEFDGEIFSGLGDPLNTTESLKLRKSGFELVGGNRNGGSKSTAMARVTFRAQVFKITVMSGGHLVKRSQGAIESGGASNDIGAAGYPGVDTTLVVRPGRSPGRVQQATCVPGES